MKKLISVFCLCCLFVSCKDNSSDHSRMNSFINNLMSKMTLEEKVGQLNLPSSGDITTGQTQSSNIAEKIRAGQVGGLFNIKGVEKIKEVQRIAVEESRLKIPLIFGMDVIHGYETVFPIPLGLAATWDREAVEETARISAIEASADGICWTFSPMVDVSRDPRWGRMSEGFGEDTYLSGELAKAMVYGYQGRGADKYKLNNQIMACVKHYALYGAAEGGRDYNTTDMSRIRMFNEYMYPYQAAIDAGVGSVMASFNEVDGIPATANKWLMTDVLRTQWGFNGFVVTDYTGIPEMVAHGIGDFETVSVRALNAGIDMDMVSEGFLLNLPKAVKEGTVSSKDIDQACRRILEAKYMLGLFENPYKFCDIERSKSEIFTEQHRVSARNVASKSFVLLKNEENILPLSKKGTIAVIGPLANTKSNMPGTWSVAVDLNASQTLVEGLKEVGGENVRVTYAKGSHLVSDPTYEENATMFGRTLHRDQEKRTNEQMLSEALSVARNADVIVAALGESSEMSGEASSRTNISIPDVQQDLLRELLKTGKPVVLVLFTGRALTLSWEAENISSILNVWFGGTESALAIADVLFGDVNPSGKLPVTFPQHVGQIPLFYNYKNTGRPLADGHWFEKFRSNYLDVSNEPLYPFGYGLSYSSFEYSDIMLSQSEITNDEEIVATITLTNKGNYEGEEVVQLYIRDLVGSVTRPVKELKDFKRVHLAAGEQKDVSFTINSEMLKFYNYDLDFVNEPGEFDLMIGGNSRDVKVTRFVLK